MRRLLAPALVLLHVSSAALAQVAPPPAQAASPPPAAPVRAGLEIGEARWRDVLAASGPDHAFGFKAEEMRNYGRDAYLLRTVENLFRDARKVPRFSGKLSDDLLAAADPAKPDVAEIVRLAFTLTDVASARNYPAPSETSWGAAWLLDDVSPEPALDAVLAKEGRPALTPEMRARWTRLPSPVKRAIVRVLLGAHLAGPWLDLAFERVKMPAALGDASTTGARLDVLYHLANAPWTDEANDQTATPSAGSFDALRSLDREYLAYGSVIALLHASVAARELRTWAATDDHAKSISGLRGTLFELETPWGLVRVTGSAENTHVAPAFLEIDLGGDDLWLGRHGVPQAPAQRMSFAIDVSGNDRWESDAPVALGCGLFGLGAVMDLAGDDTYALKESGLGCGWFGTGLLLDASGNDVYRVKDGWGEGAAHVGVGVAVDLGGNDLHECGQQSQGLGSTLGAGIVLDVAGSDRWVARDDGNVSALYLNQSVAMAQGCGFGRRADLGDGHSLAGGFGVLVDGAGDDVYHSQVWSQGAGYWWAVGILEDRGGNDTYTNGKYSWGAGAHFAIGCAVDLAGDDAYNVGNETAVNQYHGHARDGSFGIAIDGDGNDRYMLRNNCGGSADLCSIGMFWDRRGDDAYEIRMKDQGPPNGWNETRPLGTATWYVPARSFRDDMSTLGVFLDTGGKDTYTGDDRPKDDTTWRFQHDPASWGVGIDTSW